MLAAVAWVGTEISSPKHECALGIVVPSSHERYGPRLAFWVSVGNCFAGWTTSYFAIRQTWNGPMVSGRGLFCSFRVQYGKNIQKEIMAPRKLGGGVV